MNYEFCKTKFNKNLSKYDSSIVFKHNYDTFGDVYKSQPVQSKIKPITLESYEQAQTKILSKLLVQEDKFLNAPYVDVRNNYSLYFGPIETFYLERVNSNIYKNIFPDTVFDMDIISTIEKNIKTTSFDKVQENHGFVIGDVLYKNGDIYYKALAEDSNKSIVVGVVSAVPSENVFTLSTTGTIDYSGYDYTDTSLLYLSDKNPGKLTHYLNITSTVYVPVAIYINDKIVINIQQGSTGDVLHSYTDYIDIFESYPKEDLDDIISQIKNKVII